MIHHAIFGSLGRMIAILLEHHGGVLPFWLSPDQVAVAPISKDQAGYGADVLAAFEDAGIRAVAYDGADTLSRRIVAAHDMAVPVGDRGPARDEGRPGKPTRARRLTGRRSAGRGGVPPAGEGPAGRLVGAADRHYRLASPHSTASRTSWASVRMPVLVLIR
jgi:hypothetical protein